MNNHARAKELKRTGAGAFAGEIEIRLLANFTRCRIAILHDNADESKGGQAQHHMVEIEGTEGPLLCILRMQSHRQIMDDGQLAEVGHWTITASYFPVQDPYTFVLKLPDGREMDARTLQTTLGLPLARRC